MSGSGSGLFGWTSEDFASLAITQPETEQENEPLNGPFDPHLDLPDEGDAEDDGEGRAEKPST